jgi:four helix bundle protein
VKTQFNGYRFEDLDVWNVGMRIVGEIYRLTQNFPKAEMFALSDQFKRAGTSIVLNIAEGTGQPTKKGFALYINRSKSSTLECVACTKVAVQQSFVTWNETEQLEALLKEEYFKLVALAKSMTP